MITKEPLLVLLLAKLIHSTSSAMAPSIKLTYFNIEGAGEPVRLALLLAGIDFEDERIEWPQWEQLKPKTPYGKLPVMTIDGGEMKAQSRAMLHYVAALKEEKQLYQREHAYEIEEAMGLIDDMNQAFSPCLYMGMRPQVFGYEEGFQKTEEGKAIVEKIRNKFCTEDLPMFLDFLTGLLEKSGGGWLAPGDKPSIADCLAIPNVRRFSRGFIDHVPANCLNSHPKVVEWIERFCNLPEIKGRYSDGIGSTKQNDA